MAHSTTERRPRPSRARARPAHRSRRLPSWFWLALGALLALIVLIAGGSLLNGRDQSGAVSVLTTADFHALAFSPTEPSVVFFGHHNGVMRSADGGRTWQPLVERRDFDAMGLAVSGAQSAQLYVAGHDIFQVSRDGGATWQPVAHNLPGTDIHGFAQSPDDPDHLHAFVVGHGLFGSTDGGQSWEKRAGDLPGDVMAVAAAGGSPETLYAGSMRSGVLRSTDGGQTWAATTSGLDTPHVLALAVDPAARQTVYAGVEGGLYKSTDGGNNWQQLPYPGSNAVALAISPVQPNVILAIAAEGRQEGLVYRSEDGGATWAARP